LHYEHNWWVTNIGKGGRLVVIKHMGGRLVIINLMRGRLVISKDIGGRLDICRNNKGNNCDSCKSSKVMW
jgi:hypothetical protein